jgi:hypothetical protein
MTHHFLPIFSFHLEIMDDDEDADTPAGDQASSETGAAPSPDTSVSSSVTSQDIPTTQS